jgi:hypothetical protein
MRLNAKALAYASAALCGGSVLFIGLANLSSPDYGRRVLELLASVYPGYTADRSIESVMIGTGYALVKGAVVGWLLGWLYNRLSKSERDQ